MATLQVMLKQRSTTHLLAIQVSHRGKNKLLTSHYQLQPGAFSAESGRVHALAGTLSRNSASRINETLERTCSILQQRITLLESCDIPFSVDDLCDGISFEGETPPQDVFSFFRFQIATKTAKHKYASSQLYTAALHALQQYTGSARYPFAALTRETITGYLEYLRTRNLAPGTISKYLAVLHTICLRAACRGTKINREQLFTGIHPLVGHSAKRAVDKAILSRIFHLDLTDRPVLKYASDLFLFSFFAQGMSLVDILHLRRTNIQHGQIRYTRAKCGTRICLGITPQMQHIMDRYQDSESEDAYLFPTLRGIAKGSAEEYRAYRATLRATNRALLKISELLHLEVPLTTYVARHTWATNAKKSHIPIPIIQEALGHTSIRTTEIYLQQFEAQIIDRINERITRL